MSDLRWALAFLLATTILHGEGEPPDRFHLNVPLVTLDDAEASQTKSVIVLGMPRGVVVREMGEPTLQFSRDVWVYGEFQGTNLARGERRDALVVVFAHDHVSQMRLTDAVSVRALAARQKEALARSSLASR